MTHPLHEKAMSLAGVYRHAEAQLLETLMQMAEARLFVALGYTGMWEYLVKELKISESQASYFQRVAQRARVIPELKEAVLSGRLSISVARRIVGVIEESNAGEWIEAALHLKQKELERKVAEASPRRAVREGFQPLAGQLSQLTVVVTTEEEEKIERVRALVSQSLRKPASLQEAIGASVTLFLDRKDPVKKAERASLRTSKAKASASTRKAPAPVKHAVHLRDGFRCAHTDANHVRCENQRFLELHHRLPVSQGGPHTAANLTTRCFWHHRMEHR